MMSGNVTNSMSLKPGVIATLVGAMISSWGVGGVSLAQNIDRANYFVNMPDRTATMIVADGSNTDQVCTNIEFIDSRTGTIKRGTGTSAANCVGRVTSGVTPACRAENQQNCFIEANGTFLADDIDTTPPNAPTVSGDTPVNVTRPTWTWTSGGGGGNGTFRYKLNDTNLDSGATITTSTSFTPPSALAAAGHTLYVQERDTAGNWSTSGSKLITIDTAAPTAPTVTGTTPTNNTTPTWNWTPGTGGSGTFRYKLNDSNLDSGATTTTSTSFTPSGPLSEGNHTLYVQERDTAGNWSASGSKLITIDTAVPTLSFNSVSGGNPSSNLRPTIIGTASEPSQVTLYFDGSCASAKSAASVNTAFASPGITVNADVAANTTTTIYAKAIDSAGNTSCASLVTYTHDNVAPGAPEVTGTPLTNTRRPAWEWRPGGGGNGNFRYKLDDSNLSSGGTETSTAAFTPANDLSEGTHTLYVQERDAAGNWSASGSKMIIIDTTPPAAFAITGPPSLTSTTTPTITWSDATDPAQPVKYVLKIASDTACQTGVNQTWPPAGATAPLTSTSQTLTTVNNGTWYACVSAIDAAGNERIATNSGYRFIVNTAAPTITAVSLTQPTGAGTSAANVTLEFSVSMSATVFVTGTPRLPFKIGSENKYADYYSGNDTSSLIFRYSTQSGDNGDVATGTTSSLDLNGGSLRDDYGTDFSLDFTGGSTSRKVDTTAPVINDVRLTSPSGTGASGAATNLEFTVTTSESVTVTGSPTMGIKIGDTARTATYLRGSGTASLVFGYTTANDDNGIVSTPDNSTLALGNGTMTDAAGNSLGLPFAKVTTSRTIDTTPPTITIVTLSAPSGTGFSATGTNLDFTVTTSEPVTVTGTPTMGIKVGDTARTATYLSGSDTASLVFRYTTASGDTGLVSTPAGSTLALTNNATMGDAAGNTLALAFAQITTSRTIDTTVPTAPAITSPANSGYFNAQISATINQANTALDANFKDLRYTLDGADPTCSSANWIGAQTGTVVIQIGSDRTLKVIACDLAGNASSIASQVFTYDISAPGVPTLSPPAMSFSTTPFVITATKNNATDTTFFKIRYTMVQGTTAASPGDCSSGIAIDSSGTITIATATTTTIAAIACDYAGNKSASTIATYTYSAASGSSGTGAGTPLMTSQSPERKSFYDTVSRKYWNFFYSGSDVQYGYTSDGTSVVSASSLGTTTTARFAVASQSGAAFIAYEYGDNIMVRRGSISETTTGSGNWQISWGSPVAALTGTVAMPHRKPAIAIGNDGFVWVAGYEIGSSSYAPKIVSSTVLHTISTLTFGSPQMIAQFTSAAPVDPNLALVRFENDVMLLTTGSDFVIRSYVKGTSVWDAKTGPSNGGAKALKFSVSSDAAGVQLAYISQADNKPYYATFTGTSWNTPVALDSSTVNGAITLSTTSDSSKWLVAWSAGGYIKYMTYSLTRSPQWSSVTPVSSAAADNFFPVSPMEIGGSSVPLYWTKGSSTYTVTSLGITIP